MPCTTPTPRGSCTVISSRPTSCSMRKESPASPISDSRCETKISAGAPGMAGTPVIHESRTGPGRRTSSRWPVRRLQPGRRVLRALDRAPAVQGRFDLPTSSTRSGAASHARPARSTTRSPGSSSASVLKALAKRVSDRYTTARDMAEDLQRLSQDGAGSKPAGPSRRGESAARAGPETRRQGIAPRPLGFGRGVRSRSCPRGFAPSTSTTPTFSSSCFPARETAMACPRASASGRRRSRQPMRRTTFRVGLIYGPSGCGKSSLVKAGLLPRLSGSSRLRCTSRRPPTRPSNACSAG